MTFAKILESMIKEHIKESSYLSDIKGIKVLNVEFMESLTTAFQKKDGTYETLTKYMVTCSMKAKKYEDNRVIFQVNFYDVPDHEVVVYYDGTSYEA